MTDPEPTISHLYDEKSLAELWMKRRHCEHSSCPIHDALPDLAATIGALWKVARAAEKATAIHISHENSRPETRTVEIWEAEFIDLKEAVTALNKFGLPAGNTTQPSGGELQKTPGDQIL